MAGTASVAESRLDRGPNPGDMKGAGLGLLRTGWMLLGATSPIVVGVLGDLGMLREAFLLLAACAGAATLLSVFVPG